MNLCFSQDYYGDGCRQQSKTIDEHGSTIFHHQAFQWCLHSCVSLQDSSKVSASFLFNPWADPGFGERGMTGVRTIGGVAFKNIWQKLMGSPFATPVSATVIPWIMWRLWELLESDAARIILAQSHLHAILSTISTPQQSECRMCQIRPSGC